MKANNNFLLVVWLFLGFLSAFMIFHERGHKRGGEIKTIDSATTVSVKQVIHHRDTVYQPKFVDRLQIDTITQVVDTSEILRDYFAKYHYSDTLKNLLFTAVIKDTISQNRLLSRSIEFEIIERQKLVKTEITKEVEEPQRPCVYAGISLNPNGQNTGVVGYFSYEKNGHLYELGYDVLNKGLVIGYKYRLFRRKPFRKNFKTKKGAVFR